MFYVRRTFRSCFGMRWRKRRRKKGRRQQIQAAASNGRERGRRMHNCSSKKRLLFPTDNCFHNVGTPFRKEAFFVTVTATVATPRPRLFSLRSLTYEQYLYEPLTCRVLRMCITEEVKKKGDTHFLLLEARLHYVRIFDVY